MKDKIQELVDLHKQSEQFKEFLDILKTSRRVSRHSQKGCSEKIDKIKWLNVSSRIWTGSCTCKHESFISDEDLLHKISLAIIPIIEEAIDNNNSKIESKLK